MIITHRLCTEDEQDMIPTNEIIDNNGPIWVNKFTEDSARAFVKQLQFQSTRDPTAPIVIYIDSYGGDAYSLLTMISAMDAVPNEIITVAMGKAMSAGAVLLACGDVRCAIPLSTIMIHEVSSGTFGHIADMNIQHENIAQLNEKVLSLLAKRCKIKGGVAALKRSLSKVRDLYLTADEAVKFGLIDKVGFPVIQRNFSAEWHVEALPLTKASV